jgi:hypothetical protein
MNPIQPKADVLAVSLSVLCILHCLLLPIMVITIPSMASLFFVHEAFHAWMVMTVIPVSAMALYSGWKEHRVVKIGAIGFMGLLLLSCAAFLGHDFLSESSEVFLTVIGTTVITLAHIWNYVLWKTDLIDEDKGMELF